MKHFLARIVLRMMPSWLYKEIAADVLSHVETETYRWRRLYEAAVSNIQGLYEYAESRGITLPEPGDPYS